MDIKPTLLLAATLFLISAPEPDSRAIAEMTRNFIVPADERALLAAERTENRKAEVPAQDKEAPTRRTAMDDHPVTED